MKWSHHITPNWRVTESVDSTIISGLVLVYSVSALHRWISLASCFCNTFEWFFLWCASLLFGSQVINSFHFLMLLIVWGLIALFQNPVAGNYVVKRAFFDEIFTDRGMYKLFFVERKLHLKGGSNDGINRDARGVVARKITRLLSFHPFVNSLWPPR